MSIIEARPIDLATLIMFCWSLLQSGVSERKAKREFAGLRRFISGKLRITPSKVQEIIGQVAMCDNEADLRALVLSLARTENPSDAAVGFQAAGLLELSALRQAQTATQRKLTRLVKKSSRSTPVDVAATVIAAQQTHPHFLHCFGELPVAELFVAQSLRDIQRKVSFLSSEDWGAPPGVPIVLRAPYGHGKSTLLRMVATLNCDPGTIAGEPSNTIVPVYVAARDLVGLSDLQFWPAIEFAFKRMHLCHMLAIAEVAPEWESTLLLVDGFDEIDSTRMGLGVLRACFRASTSHGFGLRVVVGGRDRFFEDRVVRRELEAYGAWEYKIEGFSAGQQDAWIEKWNRLARQDGLLRPISTSDLQGPGGARSAIYATPLILFLRAIAPKSKTANPVESQIFESIIDLTVSGKPLLPRRPGNKLAGLSDRVAGVAKYEDLDELKRLLLQEVAWIAKREGGAFAPLSRLRSHDWSSVYSSAKEDHDRSPSSVMALLEAVSITHFFDAQGGGILFVHQSFVEYLCAERYLRDGGERVEMLSSINEEIEAHIYEMAECRRVEAPTLARLVSDRIAVDEIPSQHEIEGLRFAVRHGSAGDLPNFFDKRDRILEANTTSNSKASFLALKAGLWSEASARRFLAYTSNVCYPDRELHLVEWRGCGQLIARFEQGGLVRWKIVDGESPLPGIVLSRSFIKGSEFRKIHFKRLAVSSSIVEDTRFECCKIELILTGATLRGVAFVDCQINIRNYKESAFIECEFERCAIDGDVSNVEVGSCRLTECTGMAASVLEEYREDHEGLQRTWDLLMLRELELNLEKGDGDVADLYEDEFDLDKDV